MDAGKRCVQEADIFGITMPVVKHSYLVKETNDIPDNAGSISYCHYGQTRSGLIDIPKDVCGPFTGDLQAEMDLPGYTLNLDVDNNTILQISEAVAKAKRPLILAGHGAMIAQADDVLMALAEKTNIPVTSTLLGKGIFPSRIGCWACWEWTAYANKAVCECDLILNVGSRFDDRILGQPDKFGKDATIVHIDIDAAEVGKMIQPQITCVAMRR